MIIILPRDTYSSVSAYAAHYYLHDDTLCDELAIDWRANTGRSGGVSSARADFYRH